MSRPKICVVGSANIDMNSYVDRFPAPGETIHGRRFTTGYGGKGANQAVMAARLGGQVSFVGKVGNDIFGQDMLTNFNSAAIDATHVSVTEEAASGVAVITIDASGMNNIIVIPGANWLLTTDDVLAARAAITAADVLVCQLEIPAAANLAAMRLAREQAKLIVFNPAPVSEPVAPEFFALCDVACPNEHEARLLTGRTVTNFDDAEAAARAILALGAPNVIITLGERGSLLVNADQVLPVPAPAVKAVDSTGAGDAFVGSLAYFLGAGWQLPAAIRRASQIAAISVQSPGTQTSYPYARDLPAAIFENDGGSANVASANGQ